MGQQHSWGKRHTTQLRRVPWWFSTRGGPPSAQEVGPPQHKGGHLGVPQRHMLHGLAHGGIPEDLHGTTGLHEPPGPTGWMAPLRAACGPGCTWAHAAVCTIGTFIPQHSLASPDRLHVARPTLTQPLSMFLSQPALSSLSPHHRGGTMFLSQPALSSLAGVGQGSAQPAHG